MKELAEFNVKKVWDRGFIKYFVTVKKDGKMVGKVYLNAYDLILDLIGG
jgi:hypothetical protein